jgi:hypothetical protein
MKKSDQDAKPEPVAPAYQEGSVQSVGGGPTRS